MLHGVLDPQPNNLAFALFDGGKKIFEKNRPMHGRDAAILPDFISGELDAVNVKLTDISRWTIGSGPGSFTFLRLVAALAAGWKFGNPEVKFRCVPGAIALAGSLAPAPQEKVGALYDGRNKELLYFGVINNGTSLVPSGETAVLNSEGAADFFASRPQERVAVFANEAAAVSRILPENIKPLAAGAVIDALASNDSVPFDDNLDDLVYIRPAVFV